MPPAPEILAPEDLRITTHLTNGGTRKEPLPRDQTVQYRHVLHAAATMGWSPTAIVERLTVLGYTDIELPESPLATTADPDDHLLTKDNYTGLAVKLGESVPLKAVLDAAVRTGRSPADVARRLLRLNSWSRRG
jgi:hypothetical protein